MKHLSIIIAAHNEGLIAHKTLLSIKVALNYLEAKRQVKYEVLVTLDNPSEETEEYFKKQHVLPVTILHLKFGELAACRNYGISKASGKYIAIIDADDLMSKNWLFEGLRIAEEHSVIVHTEYSVNFGQGSIVWHKSNSLEPQKEALRNFDANQWDSAIITSSKILRNYPYIANGNGLGPEDWDFNCRTLANDIKHFVAPHTVLYVRRKEVSVMTQQATQRLVPHFSPLTNIEYISEIPENIIDSVKPRSASLSPKRNYMKSALRHSYRVARKVPLPNSIKQKLKKHSAHIVRNNTLDLPSWLIADWKSMHHLDKQLFPSNDILHNTVLYSSDMYELGTCLWQLASHIKSHPIYILFVPYLSKAGADLVAINYANSVAETCKDGERVLVVATERHDNPWASRLSKKVDFLPFGTITQDMSYEVKLYMLVRLLIQLKTSNLHIIQSSLAYEMLNRYKQIFKNGDYSIFASAFCDEVTSEGEVVGYIHNSIPKVFDIVDCVLTDNQNIISDLTSEYAFPEDKFLVHYQPTLPVQSRYIPNNRNIRLLWASRITKQKRPDVLVKVAKKLLLSNKDIVIDVFGSFEGDYNESFFDATPNIHYRGSFNGLDSILDNNNTTYAALIYTSERDGIPNVLLEAASYGLPVIAADVGGIKEVIGGSFLVDSPENVDHYVKQILLLANNPSNLQAESDRLVCLVESRHSQKSNADFLRHYLLPRFKESKER